MAKTETAAHRTEREKLQTQPVVFARFAHVKQYGDGTDFPFSIDFSTDAVASPTKTKKTFLLMPQGNTQTIEPELGRSSIGVFSLQLLDAGGEVLRYLSTPSLTLKTAMTAAVPAAGGFVDANEATAGYPGVGTIEITTGGVIERVRYDQNDTVLNRFRVATAGRGADVTTAAAHSVGDPIANGEQIRPGQRCQLFSGYAPLAEADYMAWPKFEVLGRGLAGGRLYTVQLTDVQRSLRRRVFLTAKPTAPRQITANPITAALRILTSTGAGTNGPYDVLIAEDGLAIPQTLVDVAGLERLRDIEFPADTYDFKITEPVDGKVALEEEVWKTLGAYPLVIQDGKLSARRHRPGPYYYGGFLAVGKFVALTG